MREKLLRGHGGLAGRTFEEPISDELVIAEPAEPVDEEAPVLSLFDGDDLAEAPAVVADGVTVDDDGAARFNTDSEFAVSAAEYIGGTSGTISFWVEPDGLPEDAQRSESLLQLRSHYVWENRAQIWKDGSAIRMVFTDSLGKEGGVFYDAGDWVPGEPRLITMTWGDGTNALWVNGELVGESEYEGELQIRSDTLLHIGSNYKEHSGGVNGVIRRFQVFNRQLDGDEVGDLVSR